MCICVVTVKQLSYFLYLYVKIFLSNMLVQRRAVSLQQLKFPLKWCYSISCFKGVASTHYAGIIQYARIDL